MSASSRLRAYLRQHHVALLALFFALAGGTAYATHPGGENTISTEDIINAQVKQPDIGASAVNGIRILNQSVRDEDLAPGTVKGSKVEDDSITGADVNESSLGQVPDAGSLDGIDSSGLIRGGGEAKGGFPPILFEGDEETLVAVEGLFIRYGCPENASADGSVIFQNFGSGTVKLFVDSGSASPSFIGDVAAGGGSHLEPASASGDHITLQAAGSGLATFEVFSQHETDIAHDCYAQAQAVLTKP